LQLIPHGDDLFYDIDHAVHAAGDAHTRSAEQGVRPQVLCDDLVGQDDVAAVFYRHPSLRPSAAVLACFYNYRGNSVARHGGVAHQEVLLLRRRVGPELG
jgi:hypothetical protein